MSQTLEEQIAELTDAIAADSANSCLYYLRGSAWHRLNGNVKAIEDYDCALALNPASAETHNDRAVTLLHLGDDVAALAGFNEAVRCDPRHALAYINRGDLRARRGEQATALADYNTVIDFLTETLQSQPNDNHALTLRGAARNRANHLEQALDDLNRAARLLPDSGKVFRHRGEVLHKLGSHGEAIAHRRDSAW